MTPGQWLQVMVVCYGAYRLADDIITRIRRPRGRLRLPGDRWWS